MTLGHYIRDGEEKDKRAKVDSQGRLSVNVEAPDPLNVMTTNDPLLQQEIFQASFSLLTMTSEQQLDMTLATGSSHVRANLLASATGAVLFQIFEAPTVGVGTPLVFNARDRRDAATPPLTTAQGGAAGISGGTKIGETVLPGGNLGDQSGSLERTIVPFLLLPNTNYLFRLDNLSASTVAASMVVTIDEDSSL